MRTVSVLDNIEPAKRNPRCRVLLGTANLRFPGPDEVYDHASQFSILIQVPEVRYRLPLLFFFDK